jgi:hypothetical protein
MGEFQLKIKQRGFDMYRRTYIRANGKQTGTKLYRMWWAMKTRCTNENYTHWEHYGGKGVKVCPQWEDFEVFRTWACKQLKDYQGKRREASLDRRDPDGDYKPPNCSIVSMRVNSRRARLPGLSTLERFRLAA